MKANNIFKLGATAALVAFGVSLSGTASALPSFTIAPSCLANVLGTQTAICNTPGGGGGAQSGIENKATFNADELNHAFKSTLALTATGNVGSVFNGTFTDNGNVEFSAFRNNGSNVLAGVSRLGVDYNMYATFTATGTFTVDLAGSPVNVIGTFTSFNIDIWVDPNLNTSFGNFDQTVTGTAGDDYKVATGTLKSGDALLSFGLASTGSFAALIQFTTLAGHNGFFYQPNPFYVELSVAGNPQTITNVGGTLPNSTYTLQGGGTAFFLVPEPATLTLFGAGLIGLAAASRRRRIAA